MRGGKPPARVGNGEEALLFDKFEKRNAQFSRWCEWLSIAAMLLMMTVTCIDVVGAKVFKWRLPGAIDMVMLSQLVAIAFAAGITLIKGRHIQVEFFIRLLPQRVQHVVDSMVLFLLLVFFTILIWQVGMLGYSFQTSGEYSATIYIPYYPFAYGIAVASVPVWLVILVKFIKSLTKGARR